MPRIRLKLVLLSALAAMPVGMVRAEGFTELLALHDRNGNGLLEAHERAMLAAAQAEQSELASLPVVCEAEPTGEVEVAAATGSAVEIDQPPQRGGAQHAQLRWEQIPMQAPPADDQPDQDADAETATDYRSEVPAPPEPPRQVVHIRNAVHYRMLLNQQQPQARPQPFAQAATFGPMVGRTKQYPHRYFSVAVHDHCGCSRASLYLAGY